MSEKPKRKVHPNSLKNLKPAYIDSSEKGRQIRQIGIEKQRREKLQRESMKNTLDILMTKALKKGNYVLPEEIQDMADVENLNIDVQTAINIAIIQRALLGDVQAVTFIRDTLGEKPKDKVEIDQSLTIEAWAKEHKVKL